MKKEDKKEKAIEWLENASYNCDNIMKANIPQLAELVKSQIENAIKYLNDEEVEDDIE